MLNQNDQDNQEIRSICWLSSITVRKTTKVWSDVLGQTDLIMCGNETIPALKLFRQVFSRLSSQSNSKNKARNSNS